MRNVLFIRPGKVAGTSITMALRLQIITSTVGLKEELEKELEKRWVTFGHLDYPRLVREGYVGGEFDSSAYKFSWVRNPYARAVSLWSSNYADMEFSEFCRNIDRKIWDIGLANAHRNSLCNPQARWLHGTRLDFLGRFEYLKDDFEKLCVEIGATEAKLSHYGASKHLNFGTYYTNKEIDIVRRVYADDFFWFGYET